MEQLQALLPKSTGRATIAIVLLRVAFIVAYDLAVVDDLVVVLCFCCRSSRTWDSANVGILSDFLPSKITGSVVHRIPAISQHVLGLSWAAEQR